MDFKAFVIMNYGAVVTIKRFDETPPWYEVDTSSSAKLIFRAHSKHVRLDTDTDIRLDDARVDIYVNVRMSSC